MDAIITAVLGIIDKLVPDKAEADKQKLALLQLAQNGQLAQLTASTDLAKAQAATNTAEAQSSSEWVSGWRPAVGWVCASALAYDFILRPLLAWASGGWWHIAMPPELDLGTLLPLLAGILGIGTLETTERIAPKGKS